MPRHCWGMIVVVLGGLACGQTHSPPLLQGGCASGCPSGQTCVNRACVFVCTAGSAQCAASGDGGPYCANLAADPFNCGSCGQICDVGSLCSNGSCLVAPASCPAGQQLCTGDAGSHCASLGSDPSNCGKCGAACSPGDECRSGVCLAFCPQDFTVCGSSTAGPVCSDLQTDPANCGGCGGACGVNGICSDGACACQARFTQCGIPSAPLCADLQTDVANCGKCGKACLACEGCVAGACVAQVTFRSYTLFGPDAGPYSALDDPLHLAVGDFDGDGLDDIAVLDNVVAMTPYPTALFVFFGDGGGGFPISRGVPSDDGGDSWVDVAAGDLNGDARADLVLETSIYIPPGPSGAPCNINSLGVTIAYADGDGGFVLPAPLPVTICDSNVYNSKGIAVVDLNSDGRPDIVLLGEFTGPAILYSLSDGGFDLVQPLPTRILAPQDANFFAAFAVGDVNGDGRTDLVVSCGTFYGAWPSDELIIMLQDADGGLSLAADTTPIGPFSAAVAGGGTIDLLAEAAAVMTFSPDAGLAEFNVYPLGPTATRVTAAAAADINGDGHADLLVANDNDLLVLLSQAGGGYGAAAVAYQDTGRQNSASFPFFYGPLLTADFNGDGCADVVAAVQTPGGGSHSFSGTGTAEVRVYLNSCGKTGVAP